MPFLADLPYVKITGALTAAYSLAVLASPKVLAGPCELTEADGSVSPTTATLCRAVSGRDLASGVAMVLASSPRAVRTAVAVRVACDLADAVILGTSLPSRGARRKGAAVGIVWGGLCALSVRSR